jgi:hypothetical protein
MAARVQGPPRTQPPTLPTVLWTLVGIVACLASAYVSAGLIVSATTFLYQLIGVWLWLPVAGALLWVGHAEKRRWQR